MEVRATIKQRKEARMQLKTILNRVQKFKSFVYGAVRWTETAREPTVEVELFPRRGSRPVCSGCGRKRAGYDTLARRRFEFIPMWGIKVFFLYAPRRVDCKICGVRVERMPWGRAHQDLSGVKAIGIDEIQWQRGHKYLTLVYQIDAGCKRLLWIGNKRKIKTLLGFFCWFGRERKARLGYICSDMWQPYLKVIAKKAGGALHILDRFHIMAHLSKAIDEVRAGEAKELKEKGYEPVLTKSRWLLLKRPENLTEKQETKLADLLQYNLRSIRSYLLKEEFQLFWSYSSPYWAGEFLDKWCTKTMRSKIEPMKKVARMLRNHRPLLLNWFRAKKQFSSGIVEGFNNKAKLTTRKAYGFRTYHAAEIALYHALGA